MPTFKVKNLSVTLEDTAKAGPVLTPKLCWIPSFHCPYLTCRYFTCGPLTPLTDCPNFSCGNPSVVPTPTIDLTITPVIKVVDDPALLDTLKGQLDDALVAIKERGVEIDQQFRPQTREDAERLEKELQAALEEVRKMKDDLQ